MEGKQTEHNCDRYMYSILIYSMVLPNIIDHLKLWLNSTQYGLAFCHTDFSTHREHSAVNRPTCIAVKVSLFGVCKLVRLYHHGICFYTPQCPNDKLDK